MENQNAFKFDPEKGEWKYDDLDNRFIMIGEPAWISIVTHLTNTFSSGTGSIIYLSGLSVGDQMGIKFQTTLNTIEGIERIFERINQAGWGKFTLEDATVENIKSDKPLKIKEVNGFFTNLIVKKDLEYLSPFIKGMLCGIISNIRGKTQVCEAEIVSKDPLTVIYTIFEE